MPKRKLDPLPSAAFQILLSLADEDLHGYAIMRQVVEQTGGRMRLGPGTLYSSIQTLLEEGCIEEVDAREDAALGPERRRYYRLTPVGRKLARVEAERLGDMLRVARAKKIFRGEHV
jgi:DNA-binding PadR family transcriptional regulator